MAVCLLLRERWRLFLGCHHALSFRKDVQTASVRLHVNLGSTYWEVDDLIMRASPDVAFLPQGLLYIASPL